MAATELVNTDPMTDRRKPPARSAEAAEAVDRDAGPAEDRRRHEGATSVLDGIMGNLLVGLSPWILYAIVEGPGRLELSAALALALAAVIVSINWIRGDNPKMLEFSDVAYFAGLAIVVAFASTGTRSWLELWGGEVANVALLAIVLGSILIRRPFTLQYAKDDVAQEYWETPEFLRTNYRIAWAWVVAFALAAASGLFGDAVLDNSNNLWTAWILQTLPMIIAAQFTIWYPNRLDALREGRIESAPTVRQFLATVTPWITTTGIIALSVGGGGPASISIALIVVGIVLTRLLSGGTNQDGHTPAAT